MTGFFWGSRLEALGIRTPKSSNAQEKLALLMRYVDERYVDSLNIDSLSTEVIQKIIDQLDPHSVFISSSEQQELSERMQGNFVGIGVSFYMVEDTVTVVRVLAE